MKTRDALLLARREDEMKKANPMCASDPRTWRLRIVSDGSQYAYEIVIQVAVIWGSPIGLLFDTRKKAIGHARRRYHKILVEQKGAQ